MSLDPSDAVVASAELAAVHATVNIVGSAEATHPSHKSATCRNCRFNLASLPTKPAYCPQCGQETAEHPPTVWEFIHEFITHYVALEGKLWKTLGLLFFRPGELTRRFLDGQKRRYVLPLRLYLTASIIFFLVVKGFGAGDLWNVGENSSGGVNAKVGTTEDFNLINIQIDPPKPPQLPKAADASAPNQPDPTSHKTSADGVASGLSEAEKAKLVMDNIRCGDSDLCRRFTAQMKKKNGGKNIGQLLEYLTDRSFAIAPYAMFLFMPIFALLMKVLYLGRGLYYGEHLVYALHVHAFTFFLLLLMASSTLAPYVALVGGFYYWFAMRRVYGGRWWATTIRYIIVAHIYPMLLMLMVMLVLVIALFT